MEWPLFWATINQGPVDLGHSFRTKPTTVESWNSISSSRAVSNMWQNIKNSNVPLPRFFWIQLSWRPRCLPSPPMEWYSAWCESIERSWTIGWSNGPCRWFIRSGTGAVLYTKVFHFKSLQVSKLNGHQFKSILFVPQNLLFLRLVPMHQKLTPASPEKDSTMWGKHRCRGELQMPAKVVSISSHKLTQNQKKRFQFL